MRVRLTTQEHEGVNYSDLTVGNVYRVLGIEADSLRIMSDEGRPYLYPPKLFVVVDPTEPEDWITSYGTAGERYSYPREFNATGFFEDYFDDRPEAVAGFRGYVAKLFRTK